jgi:hypothetical protein
MLSYFDHYVKYIITEYSTVKRDLWNHTAMLKERADKLWVNPFVSVTEGL